MLPQPSPRLHRRLLRGGLIATLGVATLFTTGCLAFRRQNTHRSSSVVSFLFPKEQPPPQVPGIPVLRLPLRVGIGFVPEERGEFARFSEARKGELLNRIAADFRSQPFVQSIQTIPALYLRPAGGFENLDQVGHLLGLDVIVLLSYDQTQFSTENRRSLAYWTIIGAYFVNGQQNDTHTLMEATVYDLQSRTLLFHAPGVDLTKATSTLVYAEREMRSDGESSLERATNDLVKNLQTELALFRQNVKEGKADVKIEHRAGYAGGGAFDGVAVTAGTLLLGGAALATRRRQHRPSLSRRVNAGARE